MPRGLGPATHITDPDLTHVGRAVALSATFAAVSAIDADGYGTIIVRNLLNQTGTRLNPSTADSDFGTVLAMTETHLVASGAGRVYVYHLSGSTWTPLQTIIPTTPQTGSGFAAAIDIDGGDLMVGQPGFADDSGSGQLHVYTLNGTTAEFDLAAVWNLVDPTLGGFGASVAIHNGQALVGVPTGQYPATIEFIRLVDGTWDLSDYTTIVPTPDTAGWGTQVSITNVNAAVTANGSLGLTAVGCSAGGFVDPSGVCTACGVIGTYSTELAETCTPAPPGYATDDPTKVIVCHNGTHQPDPGQPSCLPCGATPPRYTTPDDGRPHPTCWLPVTPAIGEDAPLIVNISSADIESFNAAWVDDSGANQPCAVAQGPSGAVIVPVSASSTVAAGTYILTLTDGDGHPTTMQVTLVNPYTIPPAHTVLTGPVAVSAVTSNICPASLAVADGALTPASFGSAHIDPDQAVVCESVPMPINASVVASSFGPSTTPSVEDVIGAMASHSDTTHPDVCVALNAASFGSISSFTVHLNATSLPPALIDGKLCVTAEDIAIALTQVSSTALTLTSLPAPVTFTAALDGDPFLQVVMVPDSSGPSPTFWVTLITLPTLMAGCCIFSLCAGITALGLAVQTTWCGVTIAKKCRPAPRPDPIHTPISLRAALASFWEEGSIAFDDDPTTFTEVDGDLATADFTILCDPHAIPEAIEDSDSAQPAQAESISSVSTIPTATGGSAVDFSSPPLLSLVGNSCTGISVDSQSVVSMTDLTPSGSGSDTSAMSIIPPGMGSHDNPLFDTAVDMDWDGTPSSRPDPQRRQVQDLPAHHPFNGLSLVIPTLDTLTESDVVTFESLTHRGRRFTNSHHS